MLNGLEQKILWSNLYHFIDCSYRKKGGLLLRRVMFPVSTPGKAFSLWFTTITAHCLGTEPQGPGQLRIWTRHLEMDLGPICALVKVSTGESSVHFQDKRGSSRARIQAFRVSMADLGRNRPKTPLTRDLNRPGLPNAQMQQKTPEVG